jgi:hypothetical protein
VDIERGDARFVSQDWLFLLIGLVSYLCVYHKCVFLGGLGVMVFQ